MACSRDNGGSDHAWAGSVQAQADASKEATGTYGDFNSSRSNRASSLAQTDAIRETTRGIDPDFNSSRSNRANTLAQTDASNDDTEATSYNSKRSPRY